MSYKTTDISILRGLRIESIVELIDEIHIAASGRIFKVYHQQECCESVSIESVDGSLQSLVGNVIVSANEGVESGKNENYYHDDSWTRTTQILEDEKGHVVTITWHGSSNGYYSESVGVEEIGGDDE